jgi:flagellar biogenesis protein FliO
VIKSIFEFIGALGIVMLIISVCVYIKAKGNTQRADELMQEELKNAAEKAGYIFSDEPVARRHNEKNMNNRIRRILINKAFFFIVSEIIAFIGVIIFFAWLISAIKNGEFSGIPG